MLYAEKNSFWVKAQCGGSMRSSRPQRINLSHPSSSSSYADGLYKRYGGLKRDAERAKLSQAAERKVRCPSSPAVSPSTKSGADKSESLSFFWTR